MTEHPLDEVRLILDAEEVVIAAERETMKSAARVSPGTMQERMTRMTAHFQDLTVVLRDMTDRLNRNPHGPHDDFGLADGNTP